MKSTKINPPIQRALILLLEEFPLVKDITKAVDVQGGRVFLVGGAVRDLLLGIATKDLDIEVQGLSMEQLEEVLRAFGPVSLVGKSFGVLRLHGLDVDWSLPRADSAGRKPKVIIDPFMSIEDAFRRRDLTINAMGIDLVTFELLDPFGGEEGLHNKLLKTPDVDLFIEDPLRFFRVMQFISRFQMYPDEELNNVCKTMDFSTVSVERIEEEFKKLLLKSKRPSLGIRWVYELDRLKEVLPELAATVGVQQSPEWHPEGCVFEHTMQAIDAAAQIPYDNPEQKLIFMYTVLCHDLGKPTTTEKIEGEWRSIGHASEGVAVAKRMLKRITRNKNLIDAVCKLVKYHMEPAQFVEGDAKFSAYKRLANKLAPHTTLQMLADVCLADKRGRNPKGHEPLNIAVPEIEEFLQQAEQAQVREEIEKPVLQGRDLLDAMEAGPAMGELLEKAYQIQLEEELKDKEELKRRVLEENN